MVYSDFDGRDDLRDGKKLDNEYNSINETDNYSNVKIKFNQDYRYFFMDSTKYYQELAEMGLVLSNMASKKKKNNRYINKTWTNNNIGEHYTVNSINDYMWYIGMDNIVDHMEEEVPYIIGQHDTIGLLGKVNNLERNVITLVIGENENYKDILAANYDGTLDKGSGNEIHHQGYDYYADKIYEQLINYDNSQNADRWKKSYWITGYGTGGAIANLVAKKFIDYKHVNTNVYCYTYQAPNTINRNNLTKRIANTKYQSIFNIENTDDIMLNLIGDEAGWAKYGVLKRLSVGDNSSVKQSWNKLTGDSYNGGSKFLSNLFNGLFNYFSGLISGFSNTYIQIDNLDYSELAKLVYYEKIKYENLDIRNSMIDYYRNDNKQLLIEANAIANKGMVANLQAKDFTSVNRILIDELQTILQPMIDVRQIDPNMTVKKALDHMGKWYVENVYTYQGGKKTVADINIHSSIYASESAKLKWEEYKAEHKRKNKITKLSSNSIILKELIDTAEYYCDKFERLGYKEKIVSDDCSRFAAAVYYHFFNRKSGITDGKGVNLKFGGSWSFINECDKERNKGKIGYVLYHNGFEIYNFNANILNDLDFELQEGDLLYRHENGYNIHGKKRSSAHLEFYIDENTSFGWGEIKNSYSENRNKKEFRIVRNKNEFEQYFTDEGKNEYKGAGIYNIKHRAGEDEDLYGKGEGIDPFGDPIIDRCDVGIPYTCVIRYTGVKR